MRHEELPEFEMDGNDDSNDGVEPIIINMEDVEPEPVEWLWPGRIAIGKLHLIVGDAGLGKSTVTCDLAARISAGREWPDDTGRAPTGTVLILSAEDDPRDTIRPRMDAAQANMKRVRLLEGKRITVEGKSKEHVVTLEDVDTIERAVRGLPDLKLLIVDPVAAYLGRADSHKESEVRGLLARLDKLARDLRFAVLLVSHLNKASALKALYRVSGSQGFTNAVRLSWLVAADTADPDRRLMVRLKGNVAADPGGLAFVVRQSEGDLMAHVEWIKGRQDVDVEALMAPPQRDSEGGSLADAIDFLQCELADGAVKAEVVYADAESAGHKRRTIDRAKRKLRVVCKPRKEADSSRHWWWWLPDDDAGNLGNVTETPPAKPFPPKVAKVANPESDGFNLDDLDRLADENAGGGAA